MIFFSSLFANKYLNSLREKVNMIPLKEDTMLSEAAQNHSNFMAVNNIFSHYENKDDPYFTGVKPGDRAVYVGYNSRLIIENISYNENSIKESIDDLFNSVYHRVGFLDMSINRIGIGVYKKFYTYDMANSYLNEICEIDKNSYKVGSFIYNICVNRDKEISEKEFDNLKYKIMKQNPEIVLWPPPNAENIKPLFNGEIPNPLKGKKRGGYPVSIIFNPYYFKNPPKLLEFRINGVEATFINKTTDINHKLNEYQFFLIPLKRLEWGKKYYVFFTYEQNGNYYSENWSFTTQKLKNLITIIDKNKITLKEGEYYFYFPKKDINTIKYIYTTNLRIQPT
ncbi:MAG: hypothetical protein DSY40_00595, partial [Nautilia sp.]